MLQKNGNGWVTLCGLRGGVERDRLGDDLH